MEGSACYAKKFGLSPVGNREPRKVSKQGRDMLRVGENGLPQSQGLEWAEPEPAGDPGRLGHFSFLESSLNRGPIDGGSTVWYPQRSK